MRPRRISSHLRVLVGHAGSFLSVHVVDRLSSSHRGARAPADNPVSPGRRPGTASHRAARTARAAISATEGLSTHHVRIWPRTSFFRQRGGFAVVLSASTGASSASSTPESIRLRQRVWPDQARLVRGFRFCEPVADRFALALRLLGYVTDCRGDMLWFFKNRKVSSACTDARTSLETTLSMVRSVSMTNVVRLTGSSRASRPRRRVCRRTPGRLTRHDGSMQLGEPASAHPEQLGHHARPRRRAADSRTSAVGRSGPACRRCRC